MIPTKRVDKFKELEIANNSLAEVDLSANFRQRKSNWLNGRVVLLIQDDKHDKMAAARLDFTSGNQFLHSVQHRTAVNCL